MLRQLIFVFIMAQALVACGAAPTSPAPSASAAPEVTPTVASVTVTVTPTSAATPVGGKTRTYHNTVVGYELDYPSGWIIDTRNEAAGTVILWSRKVEGPGVDGVPDDVVKIDIVKPMTTVQSLDELVTWEEQIIADASHTVLHEQTVQLPSGLAAVQMHVSGMGETMVLLTMIEDEPLILAGYGDLSHFADVAGTLRPAPPAG